MNLGQEWSHDPAEPLDSEEQMLVDYFDAKSGLMFTDVDVAEPVPESRPQEVDLLRIPDPPDSRSGLYRYSAENHSTVREVAEDHTVELNEIAPWGFDALGQILGKAEILRQEWNPQNIQLRLLINNSGPNPYSPERDPDPAAEAVFEKYGINLFHKYHGFIDWDDSK
jgi:hypothetical protein